MGSAMQAVIQSAVNFSEGRDASVIQAITQASRGIAGVETIDYSSDADHNRMVVTYLGGQDGIHNAIMAAADRAVELIDMRRQTGAHPRVGAVDVVPFAPVQGISMDECVDLSYRVGHDIAQNLGVPVYYYELSARTSARTRLPDIRRGGFEAIADGSLEGDRTPGEGPHHAHISAGATVVGARNPLAAYNVNLDTSDPGAAKAVVGKIRRGDADLPGVRAICVCLTSRAKTQVSMNVTRPDLISLRAVYEFVQSEAGAMGVDVAESEVIGAIRRAYLDGASPADLRIANFGDNQIIDNWL